MPSQTVADMGQNLFGLASSTTPATLQNYAPAPPWADALPAPGATRASSTLEQYAQAQQAAANQVRVNQFGGGSSGASGLSPVPATAYPGYYTYVYAPGGWLGWTAHAMRGLPGTAGNGTPAAIDKPRAVKEPARSLLKRVAVELGDGYETAIADGDNKLAIEAETLLGYRPLRQFLKLAGTLRRALAKLDIEILDQPGVDAYKAQMVRHYETSGKLPLPTWRLTRLENYAGEVPKFVLRKAVEIKRELPEAYLYIDQLAIDPFLIVSLTELYDYSTNCSRQLDRETAAYIEVWSEPKFEATK